MMRLARATCVLALAGGAVMALATNGWPTPPGVDIFADGFETGDLSKWSNASTKGGHMSVSPAARLTGSYGLLFDVAGLPPPASKAKLWVKDTSPAAESLYTAVFALNLDTLAVPTDPRVLRLMAGRVGGDPSQRPFELRLRYSAGAWSIYGVIRDDSGTGTQTAPIPIPRSWVAVSVIWRRASSIGATDGTITLLVEADGGRVGTAVASDGVANHGFAIDGIQLGFLGGLGLNSTGTAFIDDFESFGAPTPTPTPTPEPTPTPTPVCTPFAVSNGTGGSYIDNCNGTVTDSTTGLIWEKKTDDGGIHDMDNTYTWSMGDNSFNGTAKTLFLDGLNCQGAYVNGCSPWLGHADWHLPEIGDLSGLIDTTVPNCDPPDGSVACINPIFGPTAPETYVSATTAVDPSAVQTVVAYYGLTSTTLKTNSRWVRAVRDGGD